MRGELSGLDLALPMTVAAAVEREWVDGYPALERCPNDHEWSRPLLLEPSWEHAYSDQITVVTRRLACLCGEWSVLTGSFGDHRLEPRLSLEPVVCS